MTMDELFASLLVSDSNTLGLAQILVALILPFLLTFPIVFVYRKIQKNNNFTSSFILTLFLFATLSSAITMLIGNNIARAFGLVGALSIIRFRTALKDPLDAIFIFYTLSVGMAAGTGYYMLAFTIVTVVSCMLLFLNAIGISRPRYFDSILKVVINTNDDAKNELSRNLESTLSKSTKDYKRINEYFDSKKDTKTYVYTLKRPQKTDIKAMEKDIKELKGVESIAHLNQESSLFLESKH